MTDQGGKTDEDWNALYEATVAGATRIRKGLVEKADLDVFDAIALIIQSYKDAYVEYRENWSQDAQTSLASSLELINQNVSTLEKSQMEALNKLRSEMDAQLESAMSSGGEAMTLTQVFYEARLAEKAYVMSGGSETALEEVENRLAPVTIRAGLLSSRLTDESMRKEANGFIASVQQYQEAFEQLVEITNKINETEKAMLAQAELVQQAGLSLSESQQAKLTEAVNQANKAVEEAVNNSGLANQVIKYLRDARVNEKNYLISGGDDAWLEKVTSSIESAQKESQTLRDASGSGKRQLDILIKTMGEFKDAFLSLVDLNGKQATANQTMIQAAGKAQSSSREAGDNVRAAVTAQVRNSSSLILTVAGCGVFLGLLLAWLIGGGVVRPISLAPSICSRILPEGEGDLTTGGWTSTPVMKWVNLPSGLIHLSGNYRVLSGR